MRENIGILLSLVLISIVGHLLILLWASRPKRKPCFIRLQEGRILRCSFERANGRNVIHTTHVNAPLVEGKDDGTTYVSWIPSWWPDNPDDVKDSHA